MQRISAIDFFCSLEQVWFSSPSMSESASNFFILTTCFFGGMMAKFDINEFFIAPEKSRNIGRAPYGVRLISYNAVRCPAGHRPMLSYKTPAGARTICDHARENMLCIFVCG